MEQEHAPPTHDESRRGGGSKVRAARQCALVLVAGGRERPRAGKGGRRLPGQATTKHPRPPAPPSLLAHPPPTLHKVRVQRKAPSSFTLSFKCSCLEPKDTSLPDYRKTEGLCRLPQALTCQTGLCHPVQMHQPC